MAKKKTHSGIWILIVAGVLLQGISCVQYFTSRSAIRYEAEQRAICELQRAELEIANHAIEMEAAAKTLAMLAERYVECPDSIFSATRAIVKAIDHTSSIAVAYVPNYFPNRHYFEVCSSRISEDSIYTREIGSAEHDYTDLEWFQNGFIHDSCWWCEPYLDDSGSQTYVVSCSYPVRNKKGVIVAVVCVDMSLADLKNISEYLQVYPNSYYTIRASKGNYIVPAPDTIPGRKYNIYHEEIDATGWHIEIIIPEKELFAELNRTAIFVSILMLLGLVVLALLLTYSAKTTSKLIESIEQNQRMENELQIASTIQTAMLPKVFPPFMDRLDLNLYGMVNPAKEIGGDLYDFYIRHSKLFFCVGDVSGKGVPAALVMAMTRSLFRSITAHEEQPALIVRKMNRALVDQNAQNMFLTLFLGVLDCESGRLDYCNAGHNAPIIIRKDDSQVSILEVLPNLPLGIEQDFEFKAQTTQMERDDVLFLYTDGLTEAENSAHEQYGEPRMMAQLAESFRSTLVTPRDIIDQMQESVRVFVKEAEQSDDLTMMAFRYQNSALIMRNDIEQIPTLAEWIETLGIPADLSMPINLALEEIVSNVMLYAYPNTKSGQVLVECIRSTSAKETGDRLIFTITDSGIPFDPTEQAEVDTTLSAEERPIGGLGIHLVRQIMDEVHYKRQDEKNILTLVKELTK